MDFDFTPFFKKYRAIVNMAESVFERVKNDYPDCVKCRVECSDCCHALFDLSLIEALYINHRFNETINDKRRKRLLEKANRADRRVYQLKKSAFKERENGKTEAEILEKLAGERIRCPLLDETNRCELYADRPITCRLYGIPTSIGQQGHTCGLSGFIKGTTYPTVNLDAIHQMLYDISAEMVTEIKSRHIGMAEILVPLSMALLTDYNETYMGVKEEQTPEKCERENDRKKND